MELAINGTLTGSTRRTNTIQIVQILAFLSISGSLMKARRLPQTYTITDDNGGCFSGTLEMVQWYHRQLLHHLALIASGVILLQISGTDVGEREGAFEVTLQ